MIGTDDVTIDGGITGDTAGAATVGTSIIVVGRVTIEGTAGTAAVPAHLLDRRSRATQLAAETAAALVQSSAGQLALIQLPLPLQLCHQARRLRL